MKRRPSTKDRTEPPAYWRSWSAARLVARALGSPEEPLFPFWARRAWGQRGPDPDAARLLTLAWEQDPSPHVARIVAMMIRCVSPARDERARDLLLDVFTRSVEAIQGDVTAATFREHEIVLVVSGGELGRHGAPEALTALAAGLRHPQEAVRVAAAGGLAAAGTDETVAAVLTSALDGRVSMQRAASFVASAPSALRSLSDLESSEHPRATLLAKEIRRQIRGALDAR